MIERPIKYVITEGQWMAETNVGNNIRLDDDELYHLNSMIGAGWDPLNANHFRYYFACLMK